MTIGCRFLFCLFLVLLLSCVKKSFYTFACRYSCLSGIQNFDFLGGGLDPLMVGEGGMELARMLGGAIYRKRHDSR